MVARRETPAVSAPMWASAPARVAEADRREPRLGLLARELEPARGQRGDRRQQRPVEQALVQAAHALPGGLPERGELVGVARQPGRARQRAELARRRAA